MTHHTHYKRAGTHKMDAPCCRRHKRRRREAEGAQQLVSGDPQTARRERPQGRTPPAREAKAAGRQPHMILRFFLNTKVDETRAQPPRNGDA